MSFGMGFYMFLFCRAALRPRSLLCGQQAYFGSPLNPKPLVMYVLGMTFFLHVFVWFSHDFWHVFGFFDDFGLSRARSLEGDASNMILTRLAKEDSKQTATTS